MSFNFNTLFLYGKHLFEMLETGEYSEEDLSPAERLIYQDYLNEVRFKKGVF